MPSCGKIIGVPNAVRGVGGCGVFPRVVGVSGATGTRSGEGQRREDRHMVTVRLSNGTVLKYNLVRHIKAAYGSWYLKERQGCEGIIAIIPADAVLEYQAPCTVISPTNVTSAKEIARLKARLRTAQKELRELRKKRRG